MFTEDRIEYEIEYGGGIAGENCRYMSSGIVEELECY